MNAQKIHIHVESDTVTIPELKEFIGRDVELIVLEVPKTDTFEKKNSYSILKGLKNSGIGNLEELEELRKSSML